MLGESDPCLGIGETFVALAFAIEAHERGYIDSCYVQQSLRRHRSELVPIAEIAGDCAALQARLAHDPSIDPGRAAYLASQLAAMATRLEIMQGHRESLAAEARAFFEIEPQWIDERYFEDGRVCLQDQLPGAGSIFQRLEDFRARARIPLDGSSAVLDKIVSHLRELTRQTFAIPEGDEVSLSFRADVSSLGYHRYFGAYRSTVQINNAKPLDLLQLVHLLAHEAYAGHHTELVLKELNLTRRRGWLEHSLTLVDVPSCVISEGIATRALAALIAEQDLVTWCAELLTFVGVSAAEAQPRVMVEQARQRLRSVASNAALLLDEQRPADEIVCYIRERGLCDEWEARRILHFIHAARSYVFIYHAGGCLLDEVLADRADANADFCRLLSEPFTPRTVRKGWSVGATSLR